MLRYHANATHKNLNPEKFELGTTLSYPNPSMAIKLGHFRVAVCLGFEVSLGAQLSKGT